jgi:two-component system KDP operon response regulator KdpE
MTMNGDVLFLIVEDDKQIRSFIRSSLEMQQYKTVCATTGQEALNLIASRNPEVIILDLGLPDLDGIEIIRRVRSYSQMPIIVVSARDQDKEKIDALDAGADDYLTKPFSIHELLARLRVILRRQATVVSDSPELFQSGELAVDITRHLVYLCGK